MDTICVINISSPLIFQDFEIDFKVPDNAITFVSIPLTGSGQIDKKRFNIICKRGKVPHKRAQKGNR
jgi:hypothetical protein